MILFSFLTILLVEFLFLPLPSCQGAGPELHLENAIVGEDTRWTGVIEISGVVMVKRTATLTIEPGTTVRFRYSDQNRDGIGDGEIRILGRLLAKGTPEKPIRFESAREDAKAKDWSYVLIFTSHAKNEISFCQFRHGFSGLQVHFSTATVSNCLFEKNNEGMRFGRANLTIEHNRIAENQIGIRFTRMEGPVTIGANEITRNRIGVFLVPSGQNIKDFFEPDRGGVPWNTGRLTIKSNNIFANEWYNLCMGEKQYWDLDAGNNWWGAADAAKFTDLFFDKRRDQALGTILFAPFAAEQIKDAGISPSPLPSQ